MAFKDARGQRGLYPAAVTRTERISPHFVRVTLRGEALSRLPHRGYDQWFRLFLPLFPGETDLTALPQQFGVAGYLKFKTSSLAAKLAVRNYTVREHRPEAEEIDIDFVVHGSSPAGQGAAGRVSGARGAGERGGASQFRDKDAGIGSVWAQRARPGDAVALIDQGRGFDPIPETGLYLLAGDESARPAILGILRDLPSDSRGLALIEVPEPADECQEVNAPEGFEIRWLCRQGDNTLDASATPGSAALAGLRDFHPENPTALTAYVAGERTLATEGYRHLASAGVPKARIQFIGYWRA
ncbi:MAG: siderophore-interacting protein [Bifidobacteriaceae bacterium]|jgi:NADPH-dependent ferric siderophore reductase|nr:siderophore-interacting protein [Bifidobacteriaceae bacterium]